MDKQITITSGPHAGHKAKLGSETHNCGAWDAGIDCACGARWASEMNGCWQFSHKREESGDRSLYDGTTPQDWD